VLQPTDEVTVKLTVERWNQILALLSEAPYKVVAPLIQEIHQQCTAQAPQALPNGPADAAHVSH
jgi:hypothetical protein